MRLYELWYLLKGHLAEYQQRLAETCPNITMLCKRIKLLLSIFQRKLRTLSATLIPLYKLRLLVPFPTMITVHSVYLYTKPLYFI